LRQRVLTLEGNNVVTDPAELDTRYMRRWNNNPHATRKRPEDLLQPASSAPQPLARSVGGCLTHIVRFHTPKGLMIAQCGMLVAAHRLQWVAPADETFGCHKCIANAEHYGLPTYQLIPDTGCAATDGQRYRPKDRKASS
jgi:hypothetical protein